MQKCSFCGFDRGEAPAYEGRCPKCGNMVEWPDEPEQSAMAENFIGETSVGPSVTDGIQTMGELPEVRGLVQPEEDQPDEIPSRIKDVESLGPRVEDATLKLEATALDDLWRDSIFDPVNLDATLRASRSADTVSDSVFSIQQREIRGTDTALGTGADYELLNLIGQGGVGVVYAARQSSIDRKVAIKMLREEYGKRSDHRDKFLAEAVVTAELDHPNIVPIYELGQSLNGELFYSMKKVVGTLWERVIRAKPLRENIEILMKVADAVAFAHSRGVVHRDLKPENIMLGDFGEVLVMDWGIALPIEGFSKSSSILRSQAMGGTPAYMAPEMASGPIEDIGPAADVYLLGAILFEILTGKPPHYGKNVMDCVRNAAQNVIQATDVSGELFEISRKALATLPRRRYRSVQDFQAAIRLYQAHSESINLADNAERDLQAALSSQDYQELSRAVFAFREALALWSENTTAAEGLLRAQVSYAKTALEKGDYDLGLSLLDEDKPEHQSLAAKLTAARQEREARQSRLRGIRNLALALTGFIIVAGSIALVVIFQLFSQAKLLNADLAVAQQGLEKEIVNVKNEQQHAEEQRKRAEEQTALAVAQRSLAETRRQDAEVARLESVQQRLRAEESSYFAETGLITASIEQNGFAVAADLLRRQQESSSKSKLRHWEWGRNWYLVQGTGASDQSPVVETHPAEEAIASIDRTADGSWVAIGISSGECQLWHPGEAHMRFQIRHGKSLYAVDFDASGSWLVTSGTEDGEVHSLKVWQLDPSSPPVLVRTILQSSLAETVAFSNDPQASYLVSGDRQRAARIWLWRQDVAPKLLLGHLDTITSACFSRDDQFVATASLDGSVRLWRADTAKEVQRFSAHAAPVWAVEFAPHGNGLASAGADRRILLWKMNPLQEAAEVTEEIRLRLKDAEIEEPQFEVLAGHTATVRDLDFSADGRRLVSASNDNTLCVWQLAASTNTSELQLTASRNESELVDVSRLLVQLRGHGGWINTCRFSADGSQVLSGADDYNWKEWQWKNYHEKIVLGNGQGSILDAHFAPDGSKIACAMSDGKIVLWDVASGTELAALSEGHEYLTHRARFVADGRSLVTAAGDNTIRLWNVERGTQIGLLEHAGRNAVFSVSRDSQWLAATGDEEGVCVWDLQNVQQPPRRLRSWQNTGTTNIPGVGVVEPTSIAISPDGNAIFVGDRNGTCEFWDVTSEQLLHRVAGHSEAVVASFFVPATAEQNIDDAVLTISTDGTAAWWDPQSGQELPRQRLRHYAPLHRAAVSTDGQWLATSAAIRSGNSKLWLWNLRDGELLTTRELQGNLIQEIAFAESQTASLLVTTSDSEDSQKQIWSWQVASDEWRAIGATNMRPASLWGAIPTKVESQLLTFGGRGARLWQLQNNQELMSYRPSAAVQAIAFSPDSTLLAAGGLDGSIEIWDLKRLAPQRKLVAGHQQAVLDLCFSSDGRQLLSSGSDGRLVLWETVSGEMKIQGRISEENVRGKAIRYFPDGETIVVAADDHTLRIFDAVELKLRQTLEGHNDAVTCVSVSRDGRWLVSGSLDKSLRVWSVEAGMEVAKLLGHSAAIEAVAFSSDSLRVISSSQDSTAKLWDMSLVVATSDAAVAPNLPPARANLGEIFSLDFHQQATIAAEFSPDGSGILTASRDGYAVFWPAVSVSPAVRMTAGVNYQLGGGPIRIDPTAVVCQPSTFDLRNGKLLVSLEPAPGIRDRLSIDQTDGRLSITGQTLVFHSSPIQAIEIGTLTELTDTSIELTFSEQVDQAAVQHLVRHISYSGEPAESELTSNERAIVFSLLDCDGKSGNSQPETITINVRADDKLLGL